MIKQLKFLTIVILASFSLFGCDKEPDIPEEPIDEIPLDTVSINTRVYYYADVNGEELISTDVFPMNKNIYIFVDIDYNNPAEQAKQVSLVVTIPKSEGIEVRQSQGPISADFQTIEELTGGKTTKISGINFVAYPGADSQSYIFVIQGISQGSTDMTFDYEGYLRENDKSYFVSFQFIENTEVEQLLMPTYEILESSISWAHDYAEEYIMYLKQGETVIVENTSFRQTNYDISSLDPGSYTIELIAKGNGITYRDSNPRFIQFYILDDPDLSLEKNKVVWNEVINAIEYKVEFNDQVLYTSDLFYEISDLDLSNGVNDIHVIAVSDQENIIDSLNSSSISVIKLSSPVIVDSTVKIIWSAVEGAISYDIYVNGVFYENTTDLEFTKISGQNVSVKVIAVGDEIFSYNSEESNTITYQLG